MKMGVITVKEKNAQKQRYQENQMMNIKSHQRWINEIQKYRGNYTSEQIIKFSLAYTLQSLRNGENIDRFKWEE